MRKIAIFSFSIAFLVTGCANEERSKVTQLQNNANPVNCDAYIDDDGRVVPVECVKQVEAQSVYQEVEYNNHHNVAGAVAVGAVAGAVAKSAYDKNKASKVPVTVVPNTKPIGNPTAPPIQTVRTVDLAKRTYTKSTTKQSYTAPRKNTTTSRSSRSKR